MPQLHIVRKTIQTTFRGEHMNNITKMLAGLALGGCLISTGARATPIQSLTVEEIGVASGGVGTSGLAGGGGWGNHFFSPGVYPAPDAFFTSNGTDGALIMGVTQANNAFSTGFNWGGSNHFEFNTLNGAPSGSITNGVMTLNLSGLVAEFTLGNTVYPAPPDASSLITSIAMIDTNHYFYTADWTHTFNNDVYRLDTQTILPGWNGSGVTMHFEGIATLAPVPEGITTVPEPSTLWLLGASALGLMFTRRQRSA